MIRVTSLCLWAKCAIILNEWVKIVSFTYKCFVTFNFVDKDISQGKSVPLITGQEIKSSHVSTSKNTRDLCPTSIVIATLLLLDKIFLLP